MDISDLIPDFEKSDRDSATDSSLETINNFDLSGHHRKKFAIEFLRLRGVHNTACSPVSTLMPLAKLALGAKGNSERELLRAIGVSSISKLSAKFRRLIKNLKQIRGVKLNVASKIYVSNKVKLNKDFKKDAYKTFMSTAEHVDFQDPHKTSKKINEWVTKQSGKELVMNFDIIGDESAIIMNVITFKGDWETPFIKMSPQEFHSVRGIVKVPMMKRHDYFNHVISNSLKAQIIEIPYKRRDASFVLVLPYEKTGLTDLLEKMKEKPDSLNKAMKKMKEKKMTLMMPRFKIESMADISPIYKSCGVQQPFTKASGLNYIIESKHSKKELSLIVSSVIHLTTIEVDEVGTVGSAATVVEMLQATTASKYVLYANHPFLFYVKSKDEQIFAGTFAGY